MNIATTARRLPALAAALLLASGLAQAEIVSATAAAQRLQEGAQAWDVRAPGQGQVLPGAVQLDVKACLQWLASGHVQAFSAAVSAAGIDLSRDVVIYGNAGDTQAQALYTALRTVATGHVLWFVGGIAEWQLSGRSTVAQPSSRLPVPQYLVALSSGAASRMAAANLRDPAAPPELLATR
ncbi:rhodanese-like domain-containing protein [Paucibacter sp. PLA-PC-4]|uniref:rhodanese-like domain-containing protein n=1 Tax=Paucibacter sp. PLA-PC-4 TaxID=2993655 RepID=UPI00224AC1E5|nr:rhodanese-like domain-containing protein [Paucibacter sp. PLA-PC-4]MCX2863398.1 rhodanese-like domain-containing protein [Paucibacter sp. PLA-PC-4]